MLPSANPSVIFKELADGAVLFAPSVEIYFGLNEVGARVWQLLAPASDSVDDLCAKLCVYYPDVPPATIRQDVTELIAELVNQGLATMPAPSTHDASADTARAS